MKIKQIVVGPLQTNCYLLIKNQECLIIDPGDEANKILKSIGNNKIIGIIITHHHFDHVEALNNLPSDIPILDVNNLEEGENTIRDFKFEVIHTFGHSDDSITIYFKEEKLMFTGDFIFKESIGRTDLETGNDLMMKKSIANIKKYPDDIVIFPGHGDKTTLGYEKLYNHYFY